MVNRREEREPAGLTGAAGVEVDMAGLPQGQPLPAEEPQPEEAPAEARETTNEAEGPQVVLVSSYGEYETEHGTFTLGEPQAVASEDAANDLVALRGPHGEELFRRV